jgi:hypothetical protein
MKTNPLDLEIHIFEPIIVKDNVRLAEIEESFLRQKSWLQ